MPNLAYGLRASQYKQFIRFDGAFTIAFVPESTMLFFTNPDVE